MSALRAANCIDGKPPETWAGQFLGFAGAGMKMAFHCDSLGWGKWKAMLREQADLIGVLATKGFQCDARDGLLVLPVHIQKSTLVVGFENEDLEAALSPIAAAMDRIRAAKPLLDKMVSAIRAKA